MIFTVRLSQTEKGRWQHYHRPGMFQAKAIVLMKPLFDFDSRAGFKKLFFDIFGFGF
jgi:hypothetical protein